MRYAILVVLVVFVVAGCSVVPKSQYRFEEGDVLADGTVPLVGAPAFLDDQGVATDAPRNEKGEPNRPLMVVDGAKIQDYGVKAQAAAGALPAPWGAIIGAILGGMTVVSLGGLGIAKAIQKKKAGIKKAADVVAAKAEG